MPRFQRPALNLTHLPALTGPFTTVSGLITALGGEAFRSHSTLFIGLCLTAAGLIVWGSHGIRRRGRRPGFLLMAGAGSSFLLLNIYYRYSDYRWLLLNRMDLQASTEAIPYLQSRILLLLVFLLTSAALSLIPLGSRNRS